MTSHHDQQTSARGPRVGLLFTHRWPEGSVMEALTAAGMRIVCYHDPVAFANGLLCESVDIALVEDHERLFQDSMTTVRFRGTSRVPVLAIGQGSAEAIRGSLQYGAADYIVIGESMQSMVNRVMARLSVSGQGEDPSVLRVGDCWLEKSSRSLHYPNGESQLTPREFALAWVLFEHAGQVVNMGALSQQAWGRDASIAKRTIEQHVSRLRAKLAEACACGERQLGLQAVHNIGYRLVVSRGTATAAPADSGFAAIGAPVWVERRRDTAAIATA